MAFIKRHEISLKIRKPYDDAYRAKLRAALLEPGITEEKRALIKEQLDQIGKPKKYRADPAPKPEVPPRNVLRKMKKNELLSIAKARGLSLQGTRIEIINRLMEDQS